ncbi:hypothetical protein [Neoaquamicrobium sediminum]|uniref:hypothetical protein n=1 Tax=Neoaquamicrobium sediminum TaxID=1849104 RepID=UPI003BAC0EA4
MMTHAASETGGIANGAGMLPLLLPRAVSGRGKVSAETPARAKLADTGNGLAALIVLGRDDAGRPHASWFGEADAVAAAQAAELMGMVSIIVADGDRRALAGKLPQGRLFASGKAFVPFVKAALFDQIASHVSAEQRAVLEAGAGGRQAAASSGAATASSDSPKFTLPDDWSKIVANSLVLAYSVDDESWFEAAVVETKGVDEVVLRWRDWPEMPNFVRRRQHVALMHPAYAADGVAR